MRNKFLVLSLILALASCDSKTTNEISTPIDNSVAPSYLVNIKPILATNCLSCHSSGGQSPTLETYDQVKVVSGKIQDRIARTGSGVMPTSGKMAQANIDLINLWVSKGFNQ